MSIPENCKFNDIRMEEAFRGTSFSNYKLTEVRKQMIRNINAGKLEESCYWSAEMVASAHYAELWECILEFMGKYIHNGNPKIPIYLVRRYDTFRNIMNQKHYNYVLELRNNYTIRQMFAEIITILCLSVKKPAFETVKLLKDEEFDLTMLKERLKAKETTYTCDIFDVEDPKELFIAINELGYHISGPMPNMKDACYWVEWLIEFDALCRKKKQKTKCKLRDVNVDHKFKRDSIWLLWELFNIYATKKGNPLITSIVTSLQTLFCIKYTTGTAKKRKYLLYFVLEILIEHVPNNVELVYDKAKLKQVTENIDAVYKQIKKNEISPKTDYLFNHGKANLENSLKKMNMLENMEFVPRI
jgi:hypothetical protein